MDIWLAVRLGSVAAKNWKAILIGILSVLGGFICIPILILTVLFPSTKPLMVQEYKEICREGNLNWVEVMVYDMAKYQNEFEKITENDIFNSALEFYEVTVRKYREEEREREVTKKDKDGNEYTETETYYVWVSVGTEKESGSSIKSIIRRFDYPVENFKQIFSGVEGIDRYEETIDGTNYKYEASIQRLEFPIVINKLEDDKRQWIIEVIDSGLVQDMFGEEGELTPEEIEDILSKLPQTGATREKIIAIAESLVGEITYLWGGKADPPTIPTALDCSGFTDYVFKLAGAGTIGAGTYHQWDNSYPISESEIQIGDLGFMKPPSQSSDSSPNHVGIFVGYNAKGEMMFVHCEGGSGSIKTTAKRAGLSYFKRPYVKFEE
ncbi:C40 family peptidase [Clostridium sp.]|uniref:C40 family peptidase n=1 Tax=Clostridium sp. TaxID=1506 RepID=UPI003F324924